MPLHLLQVFITPMPLLRLMAACGMPHLKNLDEAVNIMREAMLGVIQVRLACVHVRTVGGDVEHFLHCGGVIALGL